jgi:ribonuclease R
MGNKDKKKRTLSEELTAKAEYFFGQNRSKAYSLKQIHKKLGLKDQEDKIEFNDIVNGLVRSGQVNRLKNGTLKAGRKGSTENLITGRIDYVNARFGYLVSDDTDDDIWINANKMNSAMDGDIVRASVYEGRGGKDRRKEGEVVEVIQRKREDFVGKLELSPRYGFVIADSKKMHSDIFVPLEKIMNARHGDKVIVKITEWPGRDKNPVGEVIEVLGAAGDNDVEMHAIMAEYGLPFTFPAKVEKEAENIEEEISAEEIKSRRDFRSITTFTIDPVDAKDFDDALSIRKLDNGRYEIGIHIADVTHYVRPGNILEKEAYNRATSVYLVDRVVPMLPEKLSNGLCSLRPNEDKLTFSAVFEMDAEAHIHDQWFGKTIIHSDRRFAYEDVQKIIEGEKGDFAEEIHILNDLAHKLRKDRFRKGSIGFETIEVKFKLDEKGFPLAVIPKIRKDAHKLIEDFMLLANKKVAEFVYFMKKGKEKNTMVYRIHDHPSPEKLSALSNFAKKFGHKLNFDNETELANTLNKLVEDVEGKPEQNVLQSLAIRTMAKAKYTTEPEIHFGLAFEHYTHFTSPIRRYPDMMVHRLLEHYLQGGKSESKEEYEEKCEHSSEMEKLAAEAERSSIKYKQVQFMASMEEDKVFDGIVSGVMEYGIFVEIVETKCEGMIRLSTMEDDFYEFDADNYRIIGKRNKKMFTLGDPVKVKVVKTDLEKRTIDLSFA